MPYVSIGNAIGGTITHCSLSGPSGRRRLESESVPLYVDIAVASAEKAEDNIISSRFISTLEDLPSEVTVVGISLYGNMIIYSKLRFVMMHTRPRILRNVKSRTTL